MKLYGAIDLHSNNNVTVVIDEQDQVVYQKRLPNELPLITEQLSGYRDRLQGIVVESTYNWYWLVDGLMDHGHRVHLANTAASQQYEGLKYTDDTSDARWLAHILRLGVLPQGYIYPKEERAVRDLLRKRSQMVRQRTTNLLSIQNLITRNTGSVAEREPDKDSRLTAGGRAFRQSRLGAGGQSQPGPDELCR
jgi:transposase